MMSLITVFALEAHALQEFLNYMYYSAIQTNISPSSSLITKEYKSLPKSNFNVHPLCDNNSGVTCILARLITIVSKVVDLMTGLTIISI